MIKQLKTTDIISRRPLPLIVLSILLSIPAILMGEYIIVAFPLLLVIILSYVIGEQVIIGIIILSFFTLVGNVVGSLRPIIQVINIFLLTYLFLKRFGLNFKGYPKIPKSIIYFLLLYFSGMIVSSVTSDYPSAGIFTIIQQLVFFIITYIFYALIRSEKYIKTYIYTLILVACILSIASILSVTGEGYGIIEIASKNRLRVSAIIENFEAATNFYVISFPIILAMLFVKKEWLNRKINLFLLVFISLGMSLAMSRSAIIGIIVNISIVLFMLRRKRLFQFGALLTLTVLVFLLYEPLNEFLTLFLRIEDGFSTRDYIWSMSFNMIKDYPLFGVGTGAYKYEMFNYYPFMLDDWYGRLYIYFHEVTGGANLSHNFFLVFFTEMGILGITTAIALPIIYLRIGIKAIKRIKDKSIDKYYIAVGLFAAGISIIIRNFFNSIGLMYVGGIQTDLPFWLIFGILVYFYETSIDHNLRLQNEHNVIV